MVRAGLLEIMRRIQIAGFAPALAASVLASQASAQLAPPVNNPPVYRSVDSNNIDLGTGHYVGNHPTISIGPSGAGGMTYEDHLNGTDNLMAHIDIVASPIPAIPHSTGANVVIGDRTYQFIMTNSANGYTAFSPPEGETLTCDPVAGKYTFTDKHGAVAIFANSPLGYVSCLTYAGSTLTYPVTQVIKPNGETWTYSYNNLYLLSSVSNNYGYAVKYNYDTSSLTSNIIAYNATIEYCDPVATSCNFVHTWPSLKRNFLALDGPFIFPVVQSYSPPSQYRTYTYTDVAGATTQVSMSWGGCTQNCTTVTYSIVQPSGQTKTITYSQLMNYSYMLPNTPLWVATSYSNGVASWSYNYSFKGYLFGGAAGTSLNANYVDLVTVMTDPLGGTRTVEALPTGQPVSVVDELGRVTTVSANVPNLGAANVGLINSITFPESDQRVYQYDARNNVTSVTLIPKIGSPLSSLVTTYNYPSSCSNPKTCNEPATITDHLGNVSSYTYDPNSGYVASVTLPAPSPGAVQPQSRYSYTLAVGNNLNAANSLVAQSSGVYLLQGISTCATLANCVGTADEIRKSYAYDSNNLAPISVTTASGSGSISATVQSGYDIVGNVVSQTNALGRVRNVVFDVLRRPVMDIDIDPGSGTRRAGRTVYDLDGKVIESDIGTTTLATGADFSSLESKTFNYDAANRKIQETTYNGGVSSSLLAVKQFSYDQAGRAQCVAVRQNMAVAGSLPYACTQSTQGANGPDQISQFAFDAAGQLVSETRGVGTPAQAIYVSNSYTGDGQLLTIKDGNGNLTQNSYDGFNRLIQTNYPSISVGSSSINTSDYEAYAYDGNGNRLSMRRRDGAVIGYAYDALNRLTSKTVPGLATVYTSFDLVNRPLSVTYSSNTGPGIHYGYDALNRVLVESNALGAINYTYDLVGNRTSVVWPDGFSVQYGYDAANRLTSMSEGGGYSLISFAYDNLNRLTGVSRGNGTSSSLSFDAADRMTGLAHAFPSSPSSNVSFGFSFTPASQLQSRSLSNANYDWPVPTINVSKAYDGLNRDATIAALNGGYDTRGNLTFDGVRTFAYDEENRLISEAGPTNASLGYDPTGRLASTTINGATTQFLYSGSALIAEYDGSGALLRRYAHGPGVDAPMVWYEGVGAASRRWLHGDKQGSIVAWSDGNGVQQATYTYGPYGEPNSWSGARFRYTGQIMLPELQLYHYKARAYDPGMGRFLQTDPVGYKDGPDWYLYVGDDPINHSDTTGLSCTGTGQETNCQIDKVVWSDKGGYHERAATKADHIRYGAFEKAYTDTVRALYANGGKTSPVSYRDSHGQHTFFISARSLAEGLKGRVVSADPNNVWQLHIDGKLASGAVTPSLFGRKTTFVGSAVLDGEYSFQRAGMGHEGIHYSPEERSVLPLGPFDSTGGPHQGPYNHASNCLQHREVPC